MVMGFPNDDLMAQMGAKSGVTDVYSMESVVSELECQVNRLKDVELAFIQRLTPVMRTSPYPQEALSKPGADMATPPMTNRALYVADQTNLLREFINRMYELLEAVDA